MNDVIIAYSSPTLGALGHIRHDLESVRCVYEVLVSVTYFCQLYSILTVTLIIIYVLITLRLHVYVTSSIRLSRCDRL